MIVVSELSLKNENFITYFHRFKTKIGFKILQVFDRPLLSCPFFCCEVFTSFDVIDDCVQHFSLHLFVLIVRGEGDFLTPLLIRLGLQKTVSPGLENTAVPVVIGSGDLIAVG